MLVEYHYENLEGAIFDSLLDSMLSTELNTQLAVALTRITARVPQVQTTVQSVRYMLALDDLADYTFAAATVSVAGAR